MANRRTLVLLMIAVAASGCGGDQPKKKGIVVQDLSVNPSEIPAGSKVTVNLEAKNTGLLEGKVDIGDTSLGGRVLVNYCSDMFNVTDLKVSSSRIENGARKGIKVYRLDNGEKINLQWNLKQHKPEEVPLPGYTCNLRFQLPFNYSVTAYKQFQVKKTSDSEGSSKLSTKSTSGPLGIDMALEGTTADSANTMLLRDNATAKLYLTAYNRGEKEENTYKGLINIGDIEVDKTGSSKISIDNDCGDRSSAALAAGSREIYKCDINVSKMNAEALTAEVTARVNYTYVRDLGSRKIQVKYNGQKN